MAISPTPAPFAHPKTHRKRDFDPPPDPPIFMGTRCKAPRKRHFFYFFATLHVSSQKINENARVLLYLWIHKLHHERKNTFFLHSISLYQNRHSYSIQQTRLKRFSSRKKALQKNDKNIKNMFSVCRWASKIQKSALFHQK